MFDRSITIVKGVGRYRIIISISGTSAKNVFDFLLHEGFSNVERSEETVTFSMETHEFIDTVCEKICKIIEQKPTKKGK